LEDGGRVAVAKNPQEQFEHGERRPVQRDGAANSIRLKINEGKTPRSGKCFGDVKHAEPVSFCSERGFSGVSFVIDGALTNLKTLKHSLALGLGLRP